MIATGKQQFKLLLTTALIAVTALSCAMARERQEKEHAKMNALGEITSKDSDGITGDPMSLIRPYLRRESFAGNPVTVVYKAGKIRRQWLSLAIEDNGLTKEQVESAVERERFDARNFHDYLVWLPKKVDPRNIKIYQKQGKKEVKPFYVEPVDSGSTSVQSLFPFSTNDNYSMLVRFRKKNKVIPSIWVQVGERPATQFQWRRPKESKRQ